MGHFGEELIIQARGIPGSGLFGVLKAPLIILELSNRATI